MVLSTSLTFFLLSSAFFRSKSAITRRYRPETVANPTATFLLSRPFMVEYFNLKVSGKHVLVGHLAGRGFYEPNILPKSMIKGSSISR